MKNLPRNAALIVIDMQQGFDEPSWPSRNNPHAEENALAILNAWRLTKRPVFHVQHSSLEPTSSLRADHPGFAFKAGFEPQDGEPHIVKHVNSAFIGTDLKEQLEAQQIEVVVILGLTTNHCVSTSTRMAGNFGFNTYLIGDATAAFAIEFNDKLISAETIYEVALANLSAEFATILTTQQLLAYVTA